MACGTARAVARLFCLAGCVGLLWATPAGTLEHIRSLLEQQRFDEAASRIELLLPEVERTEGEGSPAAADLLELELRAHRGAGKPTGPGGLERARRIVSIRERFPGHERLDLARGLRTLAELEYGNRDVAAARAQLLRALEIREAAHGEQHLDVGTDLMLLGRIETRDGQVTAARDAFARAVAIREALLGPLDPRLAAALSSLGNVQGRAGEHEAARKSLERAIEITERALGPGHVEVAYGLGNLAVLHLRRDEYHRARPLLEKALGILETERGPDHPDVAVTLDNLARLAVLTGRFDEGRRQYERALAIREGVFGPDSLELRAALSGLARLDVKVGDYIGARRRYDELLEIQKRWGQKEHVVTASLLNDAALLVDEMGDHARARAMFEDALRVKEAALGPRHPSVANTLNNLGAMHARAGNQTEARRLFERALSIKQEALGEGHIALASTLLGLSDVIAATGDRAEARRHSARALAIREAGLGPSHPALAEALDSVAALDADAGRAIAARAGFERSLAIREASLGADHPLTAQSLSRLAPLLWTAGETAAALAAASRAESIARDHLSLTSRALAESQALRYAAARASGLDLALTIASEGAGDSASRVWDSVIRSRSLVLDEMAARNRSLARLGAHDVQLLAADLGAARRRFAQLAVLGPGSDDPALYGAALERARGEKERLERALAERSAPFRSERKGTRVGLEEVASALPERSAIVSYVRYDRHVRPSGTEPATAPLPSYLAFVLVSGRTRPEIVRLGEAAAVDRLVEAWREQARTRPPALKNLRSAAERHYRDVGRRLRQAVWDPVVGRVEQAELVFVVPASALHLVNLAALPTDGQRYLVETGPLLHHLSAERDLVRERSGERERSRALLLVGGPDFDRPLPRGERSEWVAAAGLGRVIPADDLYRGTGADCEDFHELRFEPLPAARLELDEIAALWNDTSSPGGPRGNATKLTGSYADEALFKRVAAGHRLLHLATHGFFLQGDCSGSTAAPEVAENPLLLSGLALAGANRRASAADDAEDGILTAEEIASLDLSGVAWVVLSACETGVGRVLEGEGVQGLRRVFQTAGAGTLIMSLWSVQDEATRTWMRELYAARLDGRSTAEAVRRASANVIDARRDAGLTTHPFYWGAFVAAGEWQ